MSAELLMVRAVLARRLAPPVLQERGRQSCVYTQNSPSDLLA